MNTISLKVNNLVIGYKVTRKRPKSSLKASIRFYKQAN
jgi:hypothetical protein